MTALKIFSLDRGPSVVTSGGRGKLLRTAADLTRLEILVRETLQNSWDARLPGKAPTYGARIHRASTEARESLRDRIFTGLSAPLGNLASVLDDDELRLLEIFDRGTSGLDGPVRSGQAPDPGEANNFNSFVFDIGTTKEGENTGGTFGFGKTATFEVSHVYSVVYWSVCRLANGDLEHRLIACMQGDPFEHGSKRFTGAHWWGDPGSEEIIPLCGAEAKALGERIFERRFHEGETGTSILVVAPEVRIEPEDEEEETAERIEACSTAHERLLINQIASALAIHGWPKITQTPSGGESPMSFDLAYDGSPVDVVNLVQERFGGHALSLNEVRKRELSIKQTADTNINPLVRTKFEEITLRPRIKGNSKRSDYFGSRTDATSGHLHLRMSLAPPDLGAEGSLPFPANTIAFMRSHAELVVYYDRLEGIDLGPISISGVFKPTPECDHHFAQAEPSTHDSWTPSTADSEVSSYVVEKSLEQVKRKLRRWINEVKPAAQPSALSVRDVATSLRNFLPSRDADPEAINGVRRTGSHRRGGQKERIRPQLEYVVSTTTDAGRGYSITFWVKGNGSKRVGVDLNIHAKTSEGRIPLDNDGCAVTWSGAVATDENIFYAEYEDGARGEIRIELWQVTAIEVHTSLREVDLED
ncbi:hypothetical protein EJ997_06865 [Flaviflexus ciconiae]|uniref:Uncharacterized protein n=1 Tax=Flaviflexus ciconiae TaxID=2496867 RepID=A0A3S9PXE9_9ACTO|nr:hypothetical protein [Flaviflexus ciconiae]AZQ77090.1 hypothetical protein EJ997_06865 [Flaviflexus ciconiae]